MSKELFEDMDFNEILGVEPKKESTEEEIKEMAKDVVEELKPSIKESIDDLFKQGELDSKPTSDYVKEELVKALKEKHEAEFRGVSVTIEVSEDGLYDVLEVKPDPDDEEGEILEPIVEKLPNIDTAADRAAEYIFSQTGYISPEPEKKGKGKSKAKTEKPAAAPKKEEPPYEGPRTVKVWGRELWVETDPKITNEDIRVKIARDFGLPEFKEGSVLFNLDKDSGILSVALSFEKKG